MFVLENIVADACAINYEDIWMIIGWIFLGFANPFLLVTSNIIMIWHGFVVLSNNLLSLNC